MDRLARMNPNPHLNRYASNKYSQFGEDGIIEHIYSVLKEDLNVSPWVIEFGAWDGQHLSTSRNLIESFDFSAVLIEANGSRFQRLNALYRGSTNVFTINSLVTWDGSRALDELLKSTPCVKNPDFLIIDIDGNDYHVWKSVQTYRPSCVIIECNPTFPLHIEFVQSSDLSVNKGSSLLSLYLLGQSKGYDLVCVNEVNLFFVDKALSHNFELVNQSLFSDAEFHLRKYVTYLSLGYDGEVMLNGSKRLIWHDSLEFGNADFQVLPKVLISFAGNYTFLQRALYRLWKLLRLLRARR